MGNSKNPILLIVLLFLLPATESATVKDIFTIQDAPRLSRDNKYYSNRYGTSSSNTSPLNRAIKPEESPEAHQVPQTPLEKRCIRCETGYNSDSRYPNYDLRSRYEDRRDRDRYYDDYERRYDRYDDNRFDRYYDRRPVDYYDRYERGPYERYDRYDRLDRDRYDRVYDRGIGYDNRGYDYRERYDRDGYRPWDETYRGYSGWDNGGRGYNSANGRPEAGGGNWGGGYANNWNYGDRGGGGGGGAAGGYGYNRPRDPNDGQRNTSYLYGRPSTTTTNRPNNSGDGDSAVTQNPQSENSSG